MDAEDNKQLSGFLLDLSLEQRGLCSPIMIKTAPFFFCIAIQPIAIRPKNKKRKYTNQQVIQPCYFYFRSNIH